jgi:hypothetical protein
VVRPLINKVIQNHLQPEANDDDATKTFKAFISEKLQGRFSLEWKEGTTSSMRDNASFFVPRYDLKDESVHAMQAKREHVRHTMEMSAEVNEDNTTCHQHGAGVVVQATSTSTE